MKTEIKNMLVDNLAYKVVSLFVAVILWVTIIGQKDAIITKEYNLEFLLNSQYAISNEVNRTVRVRLSGPRIALKRVHQVDNTITVDINDLNPGWRIVKIHPDLVNLPLGVKVVSIQPSTVRLNLIHQSRPAETVKEKSR